MGIDATVRRKAGSSVDFVDRCGGCLLPERAYAMKMA
jgi:hypothetical protein